MHMNLKYGYIITEPGADFKRFFQGFPSVIVAAREQGLTAHQVAQAIHPHPTMSEAVMEALEAAYGEAIHG